MPTLGGGHRQAVALEDLLPLGYPAAAPAPWGARLTWSEDWLTLPRPAFHLLLETYLRQRLHRTGETRAQALRPGTFFGDLFRGLVSLRSDDDTPAHFAASGDPLHRWLGWVLDQRLWAPRTVSAYSPSPAIMRVVLWTPGAGGSAACVASPR